MFVVDSVTTCSCVIEFEYSHITHKYYDAENQLL